MFSACLEVDSLSRAGAGAAEAAGAAGAGACFRKAGTTHKYFMGHENPEHPERKAWWSNHEKNMKNQ